MYGLDINFFNDCLEYKKDIFKFIIVGLLLVDLRVIIIGVVVVVVVNGLVVGGWLYINGENNRFQVDLG